METTHWADWAETFKLQDAACLIAGVSPAKEMVAWAEKLPPEARPAFKKLWDSYLRSTGTYKRPELDSADFPKMLHGIPSEDLLSLTVVPARGAVRRREMLVSPSAELIRKRLENVRVSREELHRWVKAMSLRTEYAFAPVATSLGAEPDTAPAQTLATTTLEGAPSDRTASAGPAPLTTGDIAHCFNGLRRWNEQQWKGTLGEAKSRRWLTECVVIPSSGRGGNETRWNPVFIAGWLVQQGHVTARNVRAKFQTVDLLIPWLNEWETYEADNLQPD